MQFNKGQFNKGKFNLLDGKTYLATSSLTGEFDVAIDCIVEWYIQLGLSGLGDINTTTVKVRIGGTNLVGSSNIESMVLRKTTTSIELIGESEVSINTTKVINTGSLLTGESIIYAKPNNYFKASALLTGGFDVYSRASGVGIAFVKVIIDGVGNFNPNPYALRFTDFALNGYGKLISSPTRYVFPHAVLEGIGDIKPNAIMYAKIYGNFTGGTELITDITLVSLFKAYMGGVGDLTSDGGILWLGSGYFDGRAVMYGIGGRLLNSKAELFGKAEMAIIPFAIFMPPFMTLPTRILIEDTVTHPLIEDNTTVTLIEDTITRAVII